MLTPEKWRRIDDLFHRALEMPPEARVGWITETCTDEEVTRELISLLASDASSQEGFIGASVKDAVLDFQYEPARRSPRRAGPYRLGEELGRGGMGTVYLAHRDDEHYQAQVAVKVVRPGMDTDFILDRFRRERQTLANMQHPNIARLLDGGTTDDGLPYIVMEYIEGSNIIDYCESAHLSLEDRIRLFLSVCAAVEHAHRRFVVHRDLKPGNILVDLSGTPKLLDFGICKLLQTTPLSASETGFGVQMMTPDYASPEQVRGEGIAITSDVYSLGVILYEMATGAKAHKIERYTPTGLEEAICNREVVPPSLAARSKAEARVLAEDLDNIILKALDKDPRRRYQSVEQFSEDLLRHLENVPVRARPASIGYKAVKFWRRNQSISIAAAALLFSLLAGLVLFAREVRLERKRFDDVRNLARVFVFDVHDAVQALPGSTKARKLIVETGLRYLDSLSHDAGRDWNLKSELAGAYRRIGDVQGNLSGSHLGDVKNAFSSYQKSLALYDAIADHDPRQRDAQVNRVVVRRRQGEILADSSPKQALDAYAHAIDIGQSWIARFPDDTAMAREVGGLHVAESEAMRLAGDYSGARAHAMKATVILDGAAGKNAGDPDLTLKRAQAWSQVGAAEQMMNDLPNAVSHYRYSANLVNSHLLLDPANTEFLRQQVVQYGHLGDVLGYPGLANLGDLPGAYVAFAKAVEAARVLHRADPADEHALSDYAIMLSREAAVLPADRASDKVAILQESLVLLEQWNGKNPDNIYARVYLGFELEQLGDTWQAAGNLAKAAQAYKEGLRYARALLPQGTPSAIVTFISCSRRLGGLAAIAGNRDEALAYARAALQVGDPVTGKGGVSRMIPPRAYGAMGFVYADLLHATKRQGRQYAEDEQQAREWLGKAVSAWRALQSSPNFSAVHRAELRQTEDALAAVGHRTKS